MEESKYPTWEKAYRQALLEADPYRLIQRVRAADTLIASRLAELRFRANSHEEQQALLDASSALSVIQVEKLIPFGWKRGSPVMRS